MTFPLGEYLINKMRTYYYFEKNPPVPEKAHFTLPDPGFGIDLDEAKTESKTVIK